MFGVFLCGAAFFSGHFIGLRNILGSVFPQWSEADVVSVSERLVSAIHATLATAAGVTVVSSCHDVMTDSHWLADTFVAFGAPYMAGDIYFMYLTHFYNQRVKGHTSPETTHSLKTVKAFLIREWMLVLHHLILLLVFMPITLLLRRGLGDFFVGCLFLTELSSPFIAIGRILIQLGLDHTMLHRVNGIIVLLTFFTCRILIFPFMYAMYARQFGIPLHRVPFSLPLHCNLGNLALLLPQVYWFTLLLKKARRLYHRQTRRD
ncbi:TLC domain-containing protein 3A-like [Synchiropus splendidus]|uniref:TLC domain-containing protein 3A-like n=1 Tax=Synchiropus splendidus TaxID=270530 RepID=UPI00237D7F95|nr:TLC domain-containing protein 3A-like [Synchiropus splendidus]